MTKSPPDSLNDFSVWYDKLTPAEKVEQFNKAAELARQRAEDECKRRNMPPETPTGTCVVCGGLVKGVHQHGLRGGVDHRSVPIGPGGQQYYGWNFQGYHCEKCGLCYEFPPPPDWNKNALRSR